MDIDGVMAVVTVICTAIASVLTFVCKTLATPIKSAMVQIKQHGDKVEQLDNKLDRLEHVRTEDNTANQLMLESLIAILEVLGDKATPSKSSDNDIGESTEEIKKRLITFLSKRAYSSSVA
jgi:hypothetical protein